MFRDTCLLYLLNLKFSFDLVCIQVQHAVLFALPVVHDQNRIFNFNCRRVTRARCPGCNTGETVNAICNLEHPQMEGEK